MKICKICKNELPYDSFTKSKNVKDGYENTCKKCRQEQRKKYINTCITCGSEFRSAYKDTKYCKQACKPQSKRHRIEVKCARCGKPKFVTPSHKENYKNHYCSNECKNKHYKELYSGENHHRFSKKEIQCPNCNKLFLLNNYEIETNKNNYCSIKCKDEHRKVIYSGVNAPSYNPNKPQEEREIERKYAEYYEWRRKVFERDNYTCKKCGDKTGGNLVAHHILNYNEHKDLRTKLENGITFCDCCHKEFHSIFGYRNNNNFQIEKFLKGNKAIPSQAS